MRKLWRGMVGRCHNPKHPDFPSYGARGVTVCDRWRQSYAAFLFDLGPRPSGLTLDRIDNARGYEPGNVRWATRREQALNRRDTKLISWRGRLVTVREIAVDVGMDHTTLASRIRRGLSLEEAVSRPVDQRFRPYPNKETKGCIRQ